MTPTFFVRFLFDRSMDNTDGYHNACVERERTNLFCSVFVRAYIFLFCPLLLESMPKSNNTTNLQSTTAQVLSVFVIINQYVVVEAYEMGGKDPANIR